MTETAKTPAKKTVRKAAATAGQPRIVLDKDMSNVLEVEISTFATEHGVTITSAQALGRILKRHSHDHHQSLGL